MYPIKIFGECGRSIEDIWAEGASAYLGMTVPSMPNFSMLYGKSSLFTTLLNFINSHLGPNTNLGHNSIILMIEAQAMYITTPHKKDHRSKTARRQSEHPAQTPCCPRIQ
jgi:hypothetical protein